LWMASQENHAVSVTYYCTLLSLHKRRYSSTRVDCSVSITSA
jgi:hypothetical protein